MARDELAEDALKLNWLGPPRAELNSRPVRLETRKATALLAVLSLEKSPQGREHLAALFWPHFDGERAPANLRRTLASLHASLGREWITADRDAIKLAGPGKVQVDVDRMLERIQRVRVHHGDSDAVCESCAALLNEAVQLHKGDFLQGFNLRDCPEFDLWQMRNRDAIAQEAAWAMERLADALLNDGRTEEAIEIARRWLALDELHEPAHRSLMFMYAKSGKRSAALRQFQICSDLLGRELDQEPDEQTAALAHRIRQRKLDPPVRAPTATPAPMRAPVVPPTRLRPPPVRPRLIRRHRLSALLDEGTELPLTLVSAPAGFGKTTLLAEWAAASASDVGWLSLEDTDDDPVRLISGIASAFATLDPNIGAEALKMLQAIQVPELTAVLESLVRDLHAADGPRVLVLDDCHVLTGSESQRIVAHLAGHLPPGCHLVLASRTDPALPLSRLRARGQLAEVRAEDLRFSNEEAAEFLGSVMELSLGDADISLLHERTEGWAAGLQLAGLSVRSHDDPSGFIAKFAGSHRHIADYLVGEVLDSQSDERQDFLLRTSLLDRFCGECCDSLLDCPGSQTMLEELDRDNLFVVALDDQRIWYRYHHLFAELLRHRLRRAVSGDEIERLHERAARWLDLNGMPEDAMRHFMAGKRYEDAVTLMDRAHEAILTRGGLGTLTRWAAELPSGVVDGSPEACVTLATAHAWAGHGPEATTYLDQFDAITGSAPEKDESPRLRTLRGRAAMMRALLADVSGETNRAIELAHAGDKLLPAKAISIPRTLVPYILGKAYRYQGELDTSELYTREEIRGARAAGSAWALAATVHELIWICRLQGRLTEAERVLDEFDTFPREPGSAGPASKVVADRAEIQRERGDLESAAATAIAAQDDAKRGGIPSDIYFCALTRCRVEISRGNPRAAADALRLCEEIARNSLVWASMFPLVEIERSRIYLTTCRIDDAVSWMETYPLPNPENAMNREAVQIARARILIASGRFAEAEDILHELQVPAEAQNRLGRLLQILVLLGAAGGAKADDALRSAVDVAQQEGHVSVFRDEGEAVLTRLRGLLAATPRLDDRLRAFAERVAGPAGS